MELRDQNDGRHAQTVEKIVAKLIPHMDIRCKACGGTGVSIRSGLDCTPCGANGIDLALSSEESVRNLAIEIIAIAAAPQVLARLDDSADVFPALQEAIKLCRDSLGDNTLWSATTPLRQALTHWNGDKWPIPLAGEE